jgi:hypothetical protein
LKETAPRQWRQYLLGLWRRHANQKAEVAALYESKLRIAEALLQEWKPSPPTLKLPVTFDSWYTQPAFCHFIEHDLQMNYVGALAEDQQVVLKTGTEKLADFAARLKQEHLDAVARGKPPVFKPVTIPYKGGKEKYYSYCVTLRLHNFGKKRLVINHRQADLSDNPTCLISNRLNWQAPGITRIYRHRWPVEVYHEEGKEEGLDQYQLRNFEAIERHVALVAVVYSLLRAAQQDHAFRDKLQRELKIELDGSAPFWRRVTQAQSLWKLALFIHAGLSHGQKLREFMTPLLRAMCSI